MSKSADYISFFKGDGSPIVGGDWLGDERISDNYIDIRGLFVGERDSLDKREHLREAPRLHTSWPYQIG